MHVTNSMCYFNFNVAIVSVVSPCALVCLSAEGGGLAVRSNPVIDGTPCYSGTFDHAVCIEGRCRVSYLKVTLSLNSIFTSYQL